MVAGASTAAAAGGSTTYESSPTGTTRIATGDAATAQALASGLVGYGPTAYPAYYGGGYGDPRLDASVGLAQQAYMGFGQSQRATEVWRGQAVAASQQQQTTAAELESARAATAKAKAEARAAKAETEKVTAERDSLAADLEVSLP
ncbi:MAG: hypothetical protein UY72_C0061G0002 [Candidatus Uhrbacteria bacterium GW2011_GWD2_52_7]|uniref:Uncharacterized protein n=1 Tax=Candidatus Uhrbacteria bacterium GW2011_GWD2_52_7 TaxID=1618989 RepID=A0A0G1ZL77_9BACT|nr:MAG: hypothetical protein UY72_C0061G0002 [Candidatus Uhrbacteria bacterium GW2011_GWD2_52_7]